MWYLLHHGVRYPSKPDKVRNMLDCSAKFGGAFLNNKHLSGPDLTNQFTGVLLEFRLEDVVFMSDIEAIFY